MGDSDRPEFAGGLTLLSSVTFERGDQSSRTFSEIGGGDRGNLWLRITLSCKPRLRASMVREGCPLPARSLHVSPMANMGLRAVLLDSRPFNPCDSGTRNSFYSIHLDLFPIVKRKQTQRFSIESLTGLEIPKEIPFPISVFDNRSTMSVSLSVDSRSRDRSSVRIPGPLETLSVTIIGVS